MLKQIHSIFYSNLFRYILKKNTKNTKKLLKYNIIKNFYLKLKGKFKNYALANPQNLIEIISIKSYHTNIQVNKFLKQFFFFKVNDIIKSIITIFS
jgi:hypothetical protein